MKMHLVVALCATAFFVPASARAQGRCVERAPCTQETVGRRVVDRIREGTDAVVRNTNPEGRVAEARSTLEDCVRCAMEAARDASNRIVNGSSPEPRQSTDPDAGSTEPQDSDESPE